MSRPATGAARLAAVAALALGVAVLFRPGALVWALPVLPLLAVLLDLVKWTPLANLRVVQVAAVGQVVAVASAVLGGPVAVTAAGAALVGVAAAVTGYGVVRFRR